MHSRTALALEQPSIPTPSYPWARVGVGGLFFAVFLAGLYQVILRDLFWQWWDDPNYSHGFLVVPFSGFLAWQRRKPLLELEPQGSWLGLPIVIAGVGALVLGDVGAEFFLMRISLIILIVGLVLFHLGPEVLRLLGFPLAFLVFMVPLPSIVFSAIAFPLQRLAAENSASVLEMLGVPVLLDGNVIYLSKITLGVAEACSGIRSLISLIALAVAWAYLTLPAGWAMAALVTSALPITIVANAGRVVMTGLVGQWLGVEYARGVFHTFSGWVIFLLAFASLLAVHGLIQLFLRFRSRRTA